MTDSEEEKREENRKEDAKIREEGRKKEPSRTVFSKFLSHPLRIILVLLLIILLLLFLFWFYGLGGGGGKALPGSSDSLNASPSIQTQGTPPPETEIKVSVHRELNISFVPSDADTEAARALTCNVSWTDAATGSRETRLVSEDNMADFEFALEKTIRAWYIASASTAQDVPTVAVQMTPFPGEGTLQKITKIVHDVDSKISIMRLEK